MTQVIEEPTREDALLILILIDKEGLVGDVSDSGLPHTRKTKTYWNKPSKISQKWSGNWSIWHIGKSWEIWDCSACRRKAQIQILSVYLIPDGRRQRTQSQTFLGSFQGNDKRQWPQTEMQEIPLTIRKNIFTMRMVTHKLRRETAEFSSKKIFKIQLDVTLSNIF